MGKKFEWSGDRLRSLRSAAKLTLEEVANGAGISIAALTAYERGRTCPGVEVLASLAQFFVVPMDYLTGHMEAPEDFSEYATYFQKAQRASYEAYLQERREPREVFEAKAPWPYNLAEAILGLGEGGPGEILVQDQLDGLDAALDSLDEINPKYKRVILMFYKDGLGRHKIGKYFDVTQERIRQILAKATGYLGHYSRRNLIVYGLKGNADREAAFARAKQEKMPEQAPDGPLEDLGLSIRSFSCLKRAGINTIEELMEILPDEYRMTHIRNLGRKQVEEIQGKVREFGLSW